MAHDLAEYDLGDERMDGLRGLLAADAMDESYVRLPALEWLEMEDELPDPERLPTNPVEPIRSLICPLAPVTCPPGRSDSGRRRPVSGAHAGSPGRD